MIRAVELPFPKALPTKALARLLATLLLGTSLFVVPAATDMPGALSALDISPASAHTQQTCTTETVYTSNGGSFPVPTPVTTCVNVEHGHFWRNLTIGLTAAVACGTFAVAAGPIGGLGCSAVMAGAMAAMD